jgi:hypothetical protein
MKLLGIFRKKSSPPRLPVSAGSLGEALWSDEEERWCGHAHGVEYFLSPSGNSDVVDPALVSYAESMLATGQLFELVRRQIEEYAVQHPEHGTEVRALALQSVDFYSRKGATHMNCQLGDSAPDRFWSLEFKNDAFTGMGFDT